MCIQFLRLLGIHLQLEFFRYLALYIYNSKIKMNIHNHGPLLRFDNIYLFIMNSVQQVSLFIDLTNF